MTSKEDQKIKVSIIIRTKNEEQWISHCLRKVFAQAVKDIEVVIVDNGSTDNTLELVREFPVKVVSLEKYFPGQALNVGIKASSGEYIVSLSAHCIPKHEQWLGNLLKNFESDEMKVAGVYGRQIPFKYSSDIDKRDLLITFGLDRRIQEKDTFFHNANSMIPRSLWEKIPFDEEVTNIEDRVWAQEVIKLGYKIIYEPEAEVFHCHGIHHTNEEQRYMQTVKIMENLHMDFKGDIPDSFKPGELNVVAFIPIIGEIKMVNGINLLSRTIEQIRSSLYVKDVVVISEEDSVIDFVEEKGVKNIRRGREYLTKGKGLESSLTYALEQYEEKYQTIDAVLFVNYLFPFRPNNFFSDLIEQYAYTGSDSTIAALKNYRVFWVYGEKGYQSIGEDFKPRDEKKPIYEGLVGLGCVTSSRFIRKGALLGERVELLDIKEKKYSIKLEDKDSEEIVKYLIQKEEKTLGKEILEV